MSELDKRSAFAALGASAAVLALALATPAYAQSKDPIKIGVIAEAQSVAGSSIPQAAQLAADEINAAGGVNGRKIEIVSYDDHSTAPEAVRAFQRAVNEDHVNAVIASYISEVVLALEPWTGRLKTVMVTPGAASDVITENIAKDIYLPRLLDIDQHRRRHLRRGEGSSGEQPPHEERCGHERGCRLDDAAGRRIHKMSAEYRDQGGRPYPRVARYHGFHADFQQDRG
jgi:hypothetical protein